MFGETARFYKVDEKPLRSFVGECPHCHHSEVLELFTARHAAFESNDGLVVICRDCGGYALPFSWLSRVTRIITLSFTLPLIGLPLIVPILLASKGDLSFNELPSPGLALLMLVILGAMGVGFWWVFRGIARAFRAGPLVKLNHDFREVM